jgi:hypothetical protein
MGTGANPQTSHLLSIACYSIRFHYFRCDRIATATSIVGFLYAPRNVDYDRANPSLPERLERVP